MTMNAIAAKQLPWLTSLWISLVALTLSIEAMADEIVVVPFSQGNPLLPHLAHEEAQITLKAVVRDATPGDSYQVSWDVNGNGNYDDDPVRTLTADTTGSIRDIGRTYRTPNVSETTQSDINVRVRNTSSGEESFGTFKLLTHDFRPTNDPRAWTDQQLKVMSAMSAQESMWYLHRNITNLGGSGAGITAESAYENALPNYIQMFAENGHLPAYAPGDYTGPAPAGWSSENDARWSNDPYAETVLRLVNQQMSTGVMRAINGADEATTQGYNPDGTPIPAARLPGTTDGRGLHHLIWELVDNSVDEAMGGYASKIDVSINEDGSVTVIDDGRGIPVDIHPTFKIPAVEVALTKLHAGGKFDKKSYMISGGLHGVGVSVVNALSKKLIIEITREGKIYRQEFERGIRKTKLKIIGDAKKGESGTRITFWPDEEIFSTVQFDSGVLETRFREIAFLNAGLKISLKDEIKNKKKEFYYSGGIIEFIKWINKSKDVLHKPIYFKRESEGIIAEISVQYNNGYQENIFGFVNTINTVEGGTHVSGFKTALTRVINDYAKKNKMLKEGNLTGEDAREGLVAIVSIKIPDPQFEGQTKTKLGNSEVKGLVDSLSTVAMSQFFEENPSVAKKIVSKVIDTAKARLAAKKAKDLVRRKNVLSLGGLPGKLADCSSKKSEDTELYIVEGESAGGSAKQSRDKENQAILPLRGKILNVEKSNPARALSSEEIVNLITAIGTGTGDQFDISKLRYNKIIIMTDADVDGQHIKTLLLTFFFRYMPKLIEEGHVYAAMPPLYRIRKGQKDYYVYSDKELKEITSGGGNFNVTRFKGLGEMSLDQLWDTTMNPKTRKIEKVVIEDAVEADRVFSMLMGSDVQERKRFIQENAKEAELDI